MSIYRQTPSSAFKHQILITSRLRPTARVPWCDVFLTFDSAQPDIGPKLTSPCSSPGVLKTLDLVAGAPHDFDLHLRVLHGSSVLKFSFNGLEDAPARATVELPDLDGSTKTPETYERQSLRNETMNIDEQRLPQSNNDESGSLNSDEPLATQKRQRRNPLHHPVVGNDSYGETSDENSSSNKFHKRRHLRRKRPARGAYIEPPQDLTDIFEPDTEIFNQPLTNTTRSNVLQAPVTPRPQKNLNTYGFQAAPQTQSNMKTMPDLYMGLDSTDNLDVNLTKDPPSAKRTGRFQRSKSPEQDLGPRVAKKMFYSPNSRTWREAPKR